MLVEDLIQEGNLGLLEALGKVGEISNIEDADTFIIESIRQAMVEVVDEEIGENDWEETVLAKTGLISEAAKYLAEDGIFIASGIIDDRRDDVVAAMNAQGIEVIEERINGGWVALACKVRG